MGPMDVECSACGALYFREEKRNQAADGTFHKCCAFGAVCLDDFCDEYPEVLKQLLTGEHKLSKEFFKHIINYNSALSFASLKADERITQSGVYCYKIGGRIYHKINKAAQPDTDDKGRSRPPTYGQTYFFNPKEAANQRLKHPANKGLSKELMELLDKTIRDENPYAKAYEMMKDVEEKEANEARARGIDPPEINLAFFVDKSADKRYNVPESNEVNYIYNKSLFLGCCNYNL